MSREWVMKKKSGDKMDSGLFYPKKGGLTYETIGVKLLMDGVKF
jgi:hypothetical protein